MQWSIFALFLATGACLAEIDVSNPPNIPDIDEVAAIKERCEKKGSPDTYEKLKQAMKDTKTCVQGQLDGNQIKDELEEAKKTGSMDEVFEKYCNKRPQVKECIMKTVNVAKECMEEGEKDALNATINLIEEVGDFACFRNGDRLAMFVAEGGMECVSSRVEGIKKCVNETMKIDTGSLSLASVPALPSLTIDKKKCDDLATIQQCVVKDLEENCKDTTPANIVDALFKFIKKTTCKNIKKRRSINVKHIVKRAIQSAEQYHLGFKTKIEKLCKENGGDNAFDNFRDALKQMKNCWPRIRLHGITKLTVFDNIKNCSGPMITSLEDCLPEETKYYPKFVLEFIESCLDFYYSHSNLLQGNTNREVYQCFQTLRNPNMSNLVFDCAIQNDTQIYEFRPKQELCEKIFTFDKCISQAVKQVCAQDITIHKLVGDFISAIEKPCKSA